MVQPQGSKKKSKTVAKERTPDWKSKFESARKKQLLFKKKAIDYRDLLQAREQELAQLEMNLRASLEALETAKYLADRVPELEQALAALREEQKRGDKLRDQLQSDLRSARERVEECEQQLGKRYETQRKSAGELAKLRAQTQALRARVNELEEDNAEQRQSLGRLQAQLRKK